MWVGAYIVESLFRPPLNDFSRHQGKAKLRNIVYLRLQFISLKTLNPKLI